jgi:hypothetical protein
MDPILDKNGNAYYVKKDGTGYGTAGKLANGQYALGEGDRFATQAEIDSGFQNLSITPPVASAASITPPVPVLLGDYAKSKGLNVGWSPETGPTINGTPVNTTGLQLVNGHWQGTQEQIDRLLSPYIYISPNQDRIDSALDSYEDWLQTPYASQYAPMIQGLVSQILGRQFNYNPANDAQFQRASKELTRNVLETMNARGILNSTVSADRVTQGVADLMPQFEQIARQNFMNEGQLLMSQVDMLMGLDNTAYGRYQDEGTRLASALDTVMKMDNDQYQKWKDAYEIRYQTERDRITDEQTKIEQQRQKVQDAWDRVSELGYVDNQSSIILGVPAGTLSKEAREAKIKREQELADQRTQLKQQKEMASYQFNLNQKLAEQKNSPDAMGTASQVASYYSVYNSLLADNGNDGNKALQNAMINKQTYLNSMGSKLYENMIQTLSDLAASQNKQFSSGQQLSYQDVYNSALSMKNKRDTYGRPLYTDEEIAATVLFSDLEETDQMTILNKLGINADDMLDITSGELLDPNEE